LQLACRAAVGTCAGSRAGWCLCWQTRRIGHCDLAPCKSRDLRRTSARYGAGLRPPRPRKARRPLRVGLGKPTAHPVSLHWRNITIEFDVEANLHGVDVFDMVAEPE